MENYLFVNDLRNLVNLSKFCNSIHWANDQCATEIKLIDRYKFYVQSNIYCYYFQCRLHIAFI